MNAEVATERNFLHWPLPLLVGGIIALLVIAWLSLSYLVGPAVPRQLNIATGSSSGVYYNIATKYREALERHGIGLNVVETNGSVENLKLLRDGDTSLAIVQGGTGTPEQHAGLSSLASLYLEPVWIFYRDDIGRPETLIDLRGRRIAIGASGSGTRSIAFEWLSATGFQGFDDAVNDDHAQDGETDYRSLSSQKAAEALEAGDIDAAFFVVGADSDIVSRLVSSPNIALMSISRSKAYETRYRYLKTVTFTEGMLNLRENFPDEDTTLLATTANLVAGESLHPALIPLLLTAARDVHDDGGFFEAPREFPSPIGVDIAINPDAKRFFRNGPSFLYRYLPFRWANWIDRMKLLIAPLVVLMIPLIKLFPPVYRFRIRRRIYLWYHVLREIDQKLKRNEGGAVDFTDDILRLRRMETELAEVSVPLSYMEEFYNLRLHVNYVLGLLRERCPQTDETTHTSSGSEELSVGAASQKDSDDQSASLASASVKT